MCGRKAVLFVGVEWVGACVGFLLMLLPREQRVQGPARDSWPRLALCQWGGTASAAGSRRQNRLLLSAYTAGRCATCAAQGVLAAGDACPCLPRTPAGHASLVDPAALPSAPELDARGDCTGHCCSPPGSPQAAPPETPGDSAAAPAPGVARVQQEGGTTDACCQAGAAAAAGRAAKRPAYELAAEQGWQGVLEVSARPPAGPPPAQAAAAAAPGGEAAQRAGFCGGWLCAGIGRSPAEKGRRLQRVLSGAAGCQMGAGAICFESCVLQVTA